MTIRLTDKVKVTEGKYKGKIGHIVLIGSQGVVTIETLGFWSITLYIPSGYLEKVEEAREKIDYTKCGIRCNKCKLIEVMRWNEQNPIDCLVCGSNDWQKITLRVEE